MQRSLLSLVISVTLGARLLAQQPATPPNLSTDSSVLRWARTNAIPLRSVDAPYVDSTFAFLRPLVGSARILAVGEMVHGNHEALAFRNEVIRYAVSHLGFSAVAVESGLTEGEIVDRFIQGGVGNIDTVVRSGFTWQFDSLTENRELVQWLRTYNAHAAKKIRFYGLDLTGANDSGFMPHASAAVVAVLRYLKAVSPATAAGPSSRLLPLMDRFMPSRYVEYSPADRMLLTTTLDSVYRILLADSTRYARASSPHAYALGLRNAWMAVRINDIMTVGVSTPGGMTRAGFVRDSLMAENAAWALREEQVRGRVLVFAHNGHVFNTTAVYDSITITTLGSRLRARFDTNVVILVSAAGTTDGTEDFGGWIRGSAVVQADPTSFAGMLSMVGLPTFALVMRTGDRIPSVAAALARPWPFQLAGQLRPIIPRQAFDAIVYFNRVTPSKLR